MEYDRLRNERNMVIVSMLKCAVGAGSFSLPFAFQSGGLYLSVVLTIALGYVCFWTFELLLCCQYSIKSQSNESNIYVTYSELGSAAFPRLCFAIFSHNVNVVSSVINFSILMTSIGVCAAYIDFISESLPVIFTSLFETNQSFISRDNVPFLVFPVLLLLSSFSSFKSLIVTSTLGNFAVLFGCILVVIYGYHYYPNSFDSTNVAFHLDSNELNLSNYFGSVTFLFAIHIVLLPLVGEAHLDEHSSIQAVKIFFLITTIFNLIFGVLGYIIFSESTCPLTSLIGPCPNVLSNIHRGRALNVVKLSICIDLLFSIPLVLRASFHLLDSYVTISISKCLTSICLCCSGSLTTRRSPTIQFAATRNVLSLNSSKQGHSLDIEKKRMSILSFGSEKYSPLSQISQHGNIEDFSMPAGNQDQKSTEDSDLVSIDLNTDIVVSSSSGDDMEDVGGHNNNNNDDDEDDEDDEEVRSTIPSQDPSDPSISMIQGHRYSRWLHRLSSLLSRCLLLMVVISLAIALPQFGDMVSLVGGIICALTGYVLPPLLYFRICSKMVVKRPWLQYGGLLSCFLLGIFSIGITINLFTTKPN